MPEPCEKDLPVAGYPFSRCAPGAGGRGAGCVVVVVVVVGAATPPVACAVGPKNCCALVVLRVDWLHVVLGCPLFLFVKRAGEMLECFSTCW